MDEGVPDPDDVFRIHAKDIKKIKCIGNGMVLPWIVFSC